MKSKKITIIVLSVIAIILAGVVVWLLFFKGGSCTEEEATGSFYNSTVTTNGYKININSTESGHPSGDSIFSTDFKIKKSDNSTNYYSVDYLGVELYSSNSVPTVEYPNYVTINGKKFGYYLNNMETLVKLYYELPDKNGNIVIQVNGSNCFDANGNQAKCLAPITENVLKSSELAGIINFTVEKE